MLKEIERSKEISKKDFFNLYVTQNKPVVFDSLYDNNEVFSLWNFEYLKNNYGEKIVRAFALNDRNHTMGVKGGLKIVYIPFSKAIDSIFNKNRDEMWAVVTALADFPELEKDFGHPKYCVGESYLKGQMIVGPEKIITELHQDLLENLYTVIKGCKRIYLIKPDQAKRFTLFSRLPNFSKLNPVLEIDNPNIEIYTVDLKAGETLYIPFKWWHYLENIEPTIAVAFWWRRGWIKILGFFAELATFIYYK